MLKLAFINCDGGELMGEDERVRLRRLTVGVLLKVRELFWREFALRFAHFSGSGGCRVQRPFDSTAQKPYTPARHASRCVTLPQNVTWD